MNLNPITMQLVADKYIRLALEEDIHSEDVSTNAVMPEYRAGEVELICKQDGVIAGLPVFERVFTMLDASTKVEWAKNQDGMRYASILGYVGAGGLGLIMNEKIGWREYDSLGMILIVLFVTVMIIEAVSHALRKRLT
mgnify:CR=1 FL=1